MSKIKCFSEMSNEERLDFVAERDGYVDQYGVARQGCGGEMTCDCEVGCGCGLYIEQESEEE